jgi:hypothetical protein
MALNVPSETDQAISQMLGPATERMQTLGGAITGAGPEVAAAYKSLSSFASGLPDVGMKAAESIRALRADETLPREHRLQEGNARRAAAHTMLTKLNDGAHAAHGQLEQALTKALLPAAHRDPAQRLLNIQRVQARYGHLSGEGLVAAITKRIGADAIHDSELLSETGADLFAGKDVNEDQVNAIRLLATDHYIKRTDGSRQQIAARRAMTTMRELNIKGQLAAYHQAARLHLSKAD